MNESLAEDIAKVLATEGVGTVGTDIFTRNLDWSIDRNGVLVKELGNPESSVENPMQVQNIEITVRDKDSDAAHSKIKEIRDILHGKAYFETDNYRVLQARSQTGIVDGDSDLQGRQLYRSEFRLMFEDINA